MFLELTLSMFKAMNSNMARAQRYTCSSPSHTHSPYTAATTHIHIYASAHDTNTTLVLQVESIVVVIDDQSIHRCLHIGAGASASQHRSAKFDNHNHFNY
jgi:hypothetical protein